MKIRFWGTVHIHFCIADGLDYDGGNFPVTFGQEANAVGCIRITIIVDNEFEDVENFRGDLMRGEQDAVVIGPDDTSTVLIDDLGINSSV